MVPDFCCTEEHIEILRTGPGTAASDGPNIDAALLQPSNVRRYLAFRRDYNVICFSIFGNCKSGIFPRYPDNSTITYKRVYHGILETITSVFSISACGAAPGPIMVLMVSCERLNKRYYREDVRLVAIFAVSLVGL